MTPPAAADEPRRMGKRYDAFVSYSHSADGELAPALQAGLQRFARSWRQRRALEVFRDQTGLAVDPDLWGSICTAMDGSQWFVLLCSPDAARSEWVGKEIERWVATQGPDRLLPVVTEGTFVWDPVAGDIDLARSSAAHPALAGVFRAEPRHIDMSWARSETDLTLRNARFRDQVAEIAAPMHGTTKDELEGEDVRRQRNVRRLVRGAVAVLVVLTLAASASAAVAVRNGREAARQRDEARAQRAEAERQAREATSQRLATLSQGATGSLQPLLAVQAHRMAATPQATGAMVVAATTRSDGVLTRLTGHGGGVVAVDHGPDGTVVTVDGEGTVRAFDPDGSPVGEPVPLDATAVAALGGGRAAAATPDGVALLELGGEVVEVVDLGATPTALARLGDGPSVVAGTEDGAVVALDADGGEAARLDGAHDEPVRTVASSADGAVVASFGSSDDGTAPSPPEGGTVVLHAGADLAEEAGWTSDGPLLALTPDGAAAVVGPDGPDQAADGSFALVRLLDAASGDEQAVLGGPDYYAARAAEVSPDGSTVVVATTGGVDGAPGQLFAVPVDGSARAQLLPVQMARTVATSVAPDGASAVAGGSDDEAPVLALGGDELGRAVALDGATASSPLSASPATGLVAVDLAGGGVGVADSATGEVTVVAPDAEPGAAISPDGTRLLTSEGVLALPGGEPRGGDAPGPGPDVTAAFSADGRRAAYPTAAGDEVVVVDLGSGAVVARGPAALCDGPQECPLAGLALSADGSLLALRPVPAGAAGPAPLLLVDVTDGWAQVADTTTDEPGPVVVDGDALLVQSGPVVVRHDPPSLDPVGSGRTSEVTGAWVRAGDGLAVAGECDVDLVDPVSLRAVADVPVDTQPTEGGCLADDLGAAWADAEGTVLLTSLRVGPCDEPGACPLQRWDLDPDRLADRLCAAAGRNLTEDEWEQFLPGWDYEQTCPDAGAPPAPTRTSTTAEPAAPSSTTTEPETPSTTTTTTAPDEPADPADPADALVGHLDEVRPGLLTDASGPCDDPGVPGGATCYLVVAEGDDEVVMGVGYPESELVAVYRLVPAGGGWEVVDEHGLQSGEPTPSWAEEALGG